MPPSIIELRRNNGIVLHAECHNDRGGDAHQDTAILLHGFPDSPQTFRFLVPELVKARNLRVVVPHLRGYEVTSCAHLILKRSARTSYFMEDVADDVIAWMNHLAPRPDAKFIVVGHDWGSLVAFVIAMKVPDRISHMVNMAVAHPVHFLTSVLRYPQQVWYSYYMLVFQLPFVGELLLRRTNFVARLWRTWSPPTSAVKLQEDAFVMTKKLAGARVIAEAALGYYRSLFNIFSAGGVSTWRLFLTAPPIPSAVKCLALCGAADGCISPLVFKRCTSSRRAYAGWGTSSVRLEVVDNAGHFLHLDRPDYVNKLVVEWISS